MPKTFYLLLVSLLFTSTPVSAAGLFKCTDEKGNTTYLSTPCSTNRSFARGTAYSSKPYTYPVAVNDYAMTLLFKLSPDWQVEETFGDSNSDTFSLSLSKPRDPSFKSEIIYTPYPASAKGKRLSKRKIFKLLQHAFSGALKSERQLTAVDYSANVKGYRFTAADPKWLSQLPPKGALIYISQAVLDLKHGFLTWTIRYDKKNNVHAKDLLDSVDHLQNKTTQFNRRHIRYIQEIRNFPAKNLKIRAKRNFLKAMKKEGPEDQYLVGQWLLEQDSSEAKTWFQLAAERGYLPAIKKQ